jgi:hypothetical protein
LTFGKIELGAGRRIFTGGDSKVLNSSSSLNKTCIGTECSANLFGEILNVACGNVEELDELDGIKLEENERSMPRGGRAPSASSFNCEKSKDELRKFGSSLIGTNLRFGEGRKETRGSSSRSPAIEDEVDRRQNRKK